MLIGKGHVFVMAYFYLAESSVTIRRASSLSTVTLQDYAFKFKVPINLAHHASSSTANSNTETLFFNRRSEKRVVFPSKSFFRNTPLSY